MESETQNTWYERAIRHQTEFEKYHGRWREFRATDDGLIKTMIGLTMHGPAEVPDNNLLQLNDYCKFYKSDQQQNIDLIYHQLHNISFNVKSENVHCGITSLFIDKIKDNNDIVTCLFRTRDPKSYNNVHFIDNYGRVYNGWQDFVDNNKLPSCEYLTVSGGVYTDDNVFQKYKSPAANATILRPLVDWGTTGIAVGCIAASAFSVAPVTVAVASAAVGISGVGQSVLQLHDRSKHKQSIGLNNRQSILNYLNIAASVAGGVNTIAVTNLKKLEQLFGRNLRWASTAVTVGNCLTLAIDGGLLILNIQDMRERFCNGELTSHDVCNLALNVFFLYGSVMNVRDTYRALTKNNNTSSVVSSMGDKKLTRTQKRNLQKKRAQLRKRQQLVPADTMVVSTESDHHTNYQAIAKFGIPLLQQLCSRIYPRTEFIYEYFVRFKLAFDDFREKRIGIHEFAQELQSHTFNLYTIIKDDVQLMLDYLTKYFGNVPQSETVAQSLQNGINSINQNISEFVEDNDHTSSIICEEETIPTPYYKMITEAVKVIVSRKNVDYSVDVFEAFRLSLKFVTDELMKEFVMKYDRIVALNENITGVENAKKMASIFGTRTECDFYPNRQKFRDCIERITREENEQKTDFINAKVIALQELTNKLFSSVSLADETIGLEKTIDMLSIISKILVEQFLPCLDDIKNQAKLIYELNIEILDEQSVKEMMENIDLTIDDSEQFENAISRFEDNESLFVHELREDCATYMRSRTAEPNVELSDLTTSTNNHADSTDAAYDNAHIFISCCSQFSLLVSELDEAAKTESELFVKVVHFMGEKFVEELTLYHHKWRMQNLELVDMQGFKEMIKNLDSIHSQKWSLLNDISQKFLDNSDLTIGQYLWYYENNSPNLKDLRLWDDIIHDLEFKTIRAECNKHESNDYYVVCASRLFEVQISDETSTVERYEDFIVLKTDTHMFAFVFPGDDYDGKALIICRNIVNNTEDELLVPE